MFTEEFFKHSLKKIRKRLNTTELFLVWNMFPLVCLILCFVSTQVFFRISVFLRECVLLSWASAIHSDHIFFTLFNDVCYVVLPELMVTDLMVTFCRTECSKSFSLIHVSINREQSIACSKSFLELVTIRVCDDSHSISPEAPSPCGCDLHFSYGLKNFLITV